MKKGAIEIEKIVALAIALIVMGVIIYGFINIWGDGEDTARDMMDYSDEDCPGVRNPVTGECLTIILLIPFKKKMNKNDSE